MVFLKELFEKVNYEENKQTTKSYKKFPSMGKVNIGFNQGLEVFNIVCCIATPER